MTIGLGRTSWRRPSSTPTRIFSNQDFAFTHLTHLCGALCEDQHKQPRPLLPQRNELRHLVEPPVRSPPTRNTSTISLALRYAPTCCVIPPPIPRHTNTANRGLRQRQNVQSEAQGQRGRPGGPYVGLAHRLARRHRSPALPRLTLYQEEPHRCRRWPSPRPAPSSRNSLS